jgi:DNA-binding SARP family transcriptional activator
MISLRVHLFQSLRVDTAEGHPLDLGSPTARSLFAYLVLNRDHATDRRRLAFLFWPRGSESAARRNLRQYLHRIRRSLEPVDPQGTLLDTSGNYVRFDSSTVLWLDVDLFRFALQADASLNQLQQAVELYTGDLLEDIYDDWCQAERQTLRRQYLALLDRLSLLLRRAGHMDHAVQIAERWTAAEPYDEAAHRRLMELYALRGDRHLAVQHYRQMSARLADELDAEPLPETQALLEQIQSGSLQPFSAALQPIQSRLPVSTGQKQTPLIGRRGELALLEAAFQRAMADRGDFLLITGEAGIGKTRLVQEQLIQSAGAVTLQTACHELEAMQPYAALLPVLRQALETLYTDRQAGAHRWSAALQHLLPLPAWAAAGMGGTVVDASAGSQGGYSSETDLAIQQMLRDLLDNLTQPPLLIVLDDLHWADTPSWNVVMRLAQMTHNQPLLILGTCRMEDLPADRSRLLRALERNHLLERIPLLRLSAEDSAALARHILPKIEPDSHFLHRLYQETEGNPFFIIEVLRALQDTGRPATWSLDRGTRPALPVPISIQRVIEGRLDLLTPESQERLASAAAIGQAFGFPLLQAVTQASEEDLVAAFEAWVQRGLVREEAAGYVFSHDMIRQVAYNTLSRARRQVIHRRIAEILATVVPPVLPARLAYHYARSDQPLKALPYLVQAGEQALQARSYQEARQMGQQAISLLGHLPGPPQRSERVDLNLQLAQAYAFTGDLERAQEILAETEHLAIVLGDENRLGSLFHRAAQIYWLRGSPELAGDYARRLLRTAEETGSDGLLRAALRMLGRVGIALSTFDDAIAYLLRYAHLENSPSPPADLPIILGYLGVAYSRVGSWERALESARRGVELAEFAAQRAGNLGSAEEASIQALSFARMQLAFVYADAHNWQQCLETLPQTPDLPGANGEENLHNGESSKTWLTPLGFMLLGLRGLAVAHLGQPKTGIQLIRPALEWATNSDYRVFRYLPRFFLAQALLLAHQPYEAQMESQQALEQARQASNRWAVGIGLRLLADAMARQPNPDWSAVESSLIEAMHTLRQVRARPDLARTYLALRRLYDRAGQIAWAVDCHFRATSIFEELGMVEELRQAQGQAAHERRGAVVIPGLALKGPN